MTYVLPSLKYNYSDLEPYFDSITMELHYTKHHQTYVDKLNTALSDQPELQDKSIEQILSNFKEVPPEIQIAVRNHGGGHANHSLFWSILTPELDQLPQGELATAIQSKFNSYGDFQAEFTQSALTHFGSGWVWLAVDTDKNLKIVTTANQDSPLMISLNPILGLDLWEHAYYLKYQNKRNEYIESFWHLVNWKQVQSIYQELMVAPTEVNSNTH